MSRTSRRNAAALQQPYPAPILGPVAEPTGGPTPGPTPGYIVIAKPEEPTPPADALPTCVYTWPHGIGAALAAAQALTHAGKRVVVVQHAALPYPRREDLVAAQRMGSEFLFVSVEFEDIDQSQPPSDSLIAALATARQQQAEGFGCIKPNGSIET